MARVVSGLTGHEPRCPLYEMPDEYGIGVLIPQKPRSALDLAMDIARPGGDSTAIEIIDTRNAREVAIGQNPFVAKKEEVLREVVSSKYSMRRRGRTIPERGRMVVARVEWDELHGSIFILPNHVKNMTESNMEVVVLGCGPLRIDPVTGKEVPMSFSTKDVIGKHAIIREHAGIEFTWYDENGKQLTCYFIGQSEVWAWLEPFEGDEMNSPEISQAIAYLGPAPAPTCSHRCSFELLDMKCSAGCAAQTDHTVHVCLEHRR